MLKRFITALLALFLLSGCGAAEETQKPVDAPPSTAAEDAATGAPAAVPESEIPEPDPEPEPEADPASDADDNPIFALAPTREKLYAACVEEALSGEPVRLSLAPEDCAWIALLGCIIYPTGDDQWLIQTAEKQAILTSLVSESDLYLCPDDFLDRRNAYQPKNASECVLFLGAEEASEQLTQRCIVTDALDVYIRWDGAYYIPTAERGEEIRQTVTDMAFALRDYMQEIVNTYADEMEKDMFFTPPIYPEDTADAF